MTLSVVFSHSDPFLKAHEIAPGVFQISRRIHPISVRDQMVRAQMLIERLKMLDILGPGRQLLVIGGGAGGVVAALRATELEVSTLLIDREPELFSRLASCTSRRVDPFLYEWPSSCWSNDHYRNQVPLPWSGGPAAQVVATEWLPQVTGQEALLSNHLKIRRSTIHDEITEISDDAKYSIRIGPYPDAREDPEQFENPEQFDVVVVAQGVGSEKTGSGSYKGLKFWEADTFQEPRLGLSVPPRVLIAGAGDGALQDFIRIVTGQHPADVINALNEGLMDNPLWQQVQTRILNIQSQAERRRHWGKRDTLYKSEEDALCLEVEVAFEKELDRLQSDIPLWTQIKEHALGFRSLQDNIASIALVHPGRAFSWCFALNRFLAILLDRCLPDGFYPALSPRTMCLSDIVCKHPETDSTCFGKPHEALLADLNMLEDGIIGAGTVNTVLGIYDVIVLRFGLTDAEVLLDGREPLERQILPIHPRAEYMLNP